MNIYEYLDNPLGKGAILPGKNFILDDYNKRFIDLVMNNKIEYQILTKDDDYYFHILIPTESDERDNTYDVLIRFFIEDKTQKVSTTIKGYNIEVFSNCPSFTYTYAYAYNMNGMLISELADKYDKEVLSRPPISRNPGITVNYEKSIYFACKYIIDDVRLLSKSHIQTNSIKLTKKYFKDNVRNTAKIEFQIKESKVKNSKKVNTRSKSPVRPDSKRNIATAKTGGVNKVNSKTSTTKIGGIKPKSKIKARKR